MKETDKKITTVLFVVLLAVLVAAGPTVATLTMEQQTSERAGSGTTAGLATDAGTLNSAPTAVAEANRTHVGVGEDVFFDGSNSSDPDGDPLSYEWDFDDGTYEMGVNATHSFDAAGTYNVTLTVYDGNATDTDTVEITVNDSAEGGLVSHWKFDDSNTTTTAIDSAGTNDGTIHGAEYVQGPNGTALEFNGTDNVTLSSDIAVDESRTFAMWAGITDNQTTQHLITDMGGSGDRGWWIVVSDTGELRWGGSDDGSDARLANRTSTNASLVSFTWYHVVVVYDQPAQEVTLYLDGERLAHDNGSVHSSYADSLERTTFGEYPFGSFDGRLDDVRLYNRTLSDEEVAALYNGTNNSAPTAVAEANRTTVAVGEDVFFDGSNSSDPDGEPLSYEWDFGDGSYEMGVNATHSFDAAGVYNVTLTVYDGIATDIDTVEITVGDVQDDPEHHWKFDDPNTTTTAIDSTGTNNGTIYGAEYVTGPNGNGTALEFNGTDNVTLSSDIAVDESRTFAMWVGITDNQTTQHLITDMGGSGDRGWWILTSDTGELRWGGSDDGSDARLANRTSTNASLVSFTWYHVVVVYDQPAQEVTLYLDGERLAHDGGVVYSSYNDSSEPTTFGESPLGSFDGVLDDVRLYNRTLSDEEVAVLYAEST